jgi:hypothetical protein
MSGSRRRADRAAQPGGFIQERTVNRGGRRIPRENP